MRILLIYPDADPKSIVPQALINIEPLGLEYLAAELADHEVRILDLKNERDWLGAIARQPADLVGVTGTVVHQPRILEICRHVKALDPRTVTVVGGTHATLAPQDLASPTVDAIIRGQDPRVLRRLVESLERHRPLESTAGLMLRSRSGWTETPALPPLDSLDHLRLPRRDLTARYRRRYRHLFWQPVALVITSIGCPHSCLFCPCPALTERRVLRRAPELVLQELERIDEPYIYIGDDNLFHDHRHAARLADLIAAAGLRKQYYALSRADSIVAHPELIERWAALGLKKVFVGLESPMDSELVALNKSGTVAQNDRAIAILQSNGVDPLGAFLVDPSYTRRDFDRIIDYMDRRRIYYFELTVVTPLPGTQFHDAMNDRLTTGDRRLFDLAHSVLPTLLPIAEFHREFVRLNLRAANPLRALRIRPVVSPFRRLAFVRQLPRLVSLFLGVRRTYRRLECDHGRQRRAAWRLWEESHGHP